MRRLGLRNGEKQWKETLDSSIAGQIDSILLSYKVPMVDATGNVSSPATPR
jgi:hypothetical protein